MAGPRHALAALAALAAVGGGARADTRSFDVDHYELALTSGEFLGLEGAAPVQPWAFRVAATYRYLDRPLVGEVPGGPPQVLLATRSALDVTGGVQLGRWFGLGLDVPLLLEQSGESAPQGVALGDLRLLGRLELFQAGTLRGALLFGLRLPTGAADRFLGERQLVYEPRAALEWSIGWFRLALNLGSRIRGARSYGDLTVGSELFASAGLGVRPLPFLDLFGEIHAQTLLSSAIFQAATSPVEAVGGVGGRWRGFGLRAAAGFGVVDGYGSPRFRVLLSFEWSPARAPAPPKPAAVAVTKPAPIKASVPAPPASAPAPAPAPEGEDGAAEDAGEEPSVAVDDEFVTLARPIFFERDHAHVGSRYHAELDELARALNRRPWIRVLWIEGHTDATGPAEWNRRLAELRAKAVARALERRGVAPERLGTLAAGERKPWFSNAQREGQAKNRRVMFIIERQGQQGAQPPEHPGERPPPVAPANQEARRAP